jgi:transposase
VPQDLLKPAQLKVAQLSARGLSTRQVEAETGVSKATVARWLKVPEIQAQVKKFKQEIEVEHHRANRQSANQEAADLQEHLRSAAQRQLQWSGEVQKAGYNLLSKVNEWVTEIDAVIKSEPQQDGKGKTSMDLRSLMLLKLIPFVATYARAAAEMTRAGSETEDKIFAIEEISRRLDEWQEVMDGNNSDNRQATASEQ